MTESPQPDRAGMLEAGFAAVDEAAVEDAGRFYAAIALERGSRLPEFPGLEPGDVLAAGPILLARRDAAARRHWERQRERLADLPARSTDLSRAERLLSFFERGG